MPNFKALNLPNLGVRIVNRNCPDAPPDGSIGLQPVSRHPAQALHEPAPKKLLYFRTINQNRLIMKLIQFSALGYSKLPDSQRA
jgi:hypothetical protein